MCRTDAGVTKKRRCAGGKRIWCAGMPAVFLGLFGGEKIQQGLHFGAVPGFGWRRPAGGDSVALSLVHFWEAEANTMTTTRLQLEKRTRLGSVRTLVNEISPAWLHAVHKAKHAGTPRLVRKDYDDC